MEATADSIISAGRSTKNFIPEVEKLGQLVARLGFHCSSFSRLRVMNC